MTPEEFFPPRDKKTFATGYLKIENYQNCRIALIDACKKKPDIFIVLQKAANGTLEKPEGGEKFRLSLTGHLRDGVETSARCDDATNIEAHWRYDATRRKGRAHPHDALEAACKGLEDWLQRLKPPKNKSEHRNATDDPRAYRRQRSEDLKRDKNLIYDETLHLPLEERRSWQSFSTKGYETPPEVRTPPRPAVEERDVRNFLREANSKLEQDIMAQNSRYESLKASNPREVKPASKPDADQGRGR